MHTKKQKNNIENIPELQPKKKNQLYIDTKKKTEIK